MPITIIPADQVVIVDGRAAIVKIEGLEEVQAIQWLDDSGWIEYRDGRPNQSLTGDGFGQAVKPWLDLHQAEISRLDSCPGPLYDWDESSGQWRMSGERSQAARRSALEQEIIALEVRGERPIREIILAQSRGEAAPAGALQILAEIEAAIEPKRSELAELKVEIVKE